MDQDIILVKPTEPISTIWLNRSSELNLLNADMLRSLQNTFERLRSVDGLRAVILSSMSDETFSAGVDVRSIFDLGPGAIAEFVESGQRLMRCIESFPVPVLASIQGLALGSGLELALACDLIFVSDKARLGLTDVNFGLLPPFGGLERLRNRCGNGTAARLLYSAEIVSAQEAQQIGLVDRLFPSEDLPVEIRKTADEIAARAPLAIQAIKRGLRGSAGWNLHAGLRQGVEEYLNLYCSLDREEGMNAFLQNRTPQFKGK